MTAEPIPARPRARRRARRLVLAADAARTSRARDRGRPAAARDPRRHHRRAATARDGAHRPRRLRRRGAARGRRARLERFVLVGHSMGGLTIAEVARRAPQRVAHLVFVSCIVPPEGVHDGRRPPRGRPRDDARRRSTRARAGDVSLGPGMDDALKRSHVLQRHGRRADALRARALRARVPDPRSSTPSPRAGIPPSLPKTYVRLLRDQALEPAVQDEQIANLRASPGGDARRRRARHRPRRDGQPPRDLASLNGSAAPTAHRRATVRRARERSERGVSDQGGPGGSASAGTCRAARSRRACASRRRSCS